MMTTEKSAQTYMDLLRGFGDKLGLPQIDVEKLIEANRKNLDALNKSAIAAAGGAQAVVRKQREVLEAGLTEATTLIRGYQPLGDPRETLTKQTDFAKKLFELALQGAKDFRPDDPGVDGGGGEDPSRPHEGGSRRRSGQRRPGRQIEDVTPPKRVLPG